MTTIVRYAHHNPDRPVAVRADLKGSHREHCLCFGCAKFGGGDSGRKCPIAAELYALCQKHDLVAPVWECPEFEEAAAP